MRNLFLVWAILNVVNVSNDVSKVKLILLNRLSCYLLYCIREIAQISSMISSLLFDKCLLPILVFLSTVLVWIGHLQVTQFLIYLYWSSCTIHRRDTTLLQLLHSFAFCVCLSNLGIHFVYLLLLVLLMAWRTKTTRDVTAGCQTLNV